MSRRFLQVPYGRGEADAITAQKSDTIPSCSPSPNRVGPELLRACSCIGRADPRIDGGAGRADGNLRSFHVAVEDKETVSKIVLDNVSKEARLFTDESRLYSGAQISSSLS